MESKPTTPTKHVESDALLPPDENSRLTRAWPWLVLACSSITVIILGGKRRAFGAFVSQLKVEYNGTVSLPELNWIGDSYAALGYLTTGLSTTAILYCDRRFREFQLLGAVLILVSCVTSSFVPNPHWLFLTHTLIHGAGSSLVLAVVGLVVNEYFSDNHPYRMLATTLVSGGSIGAIVFVQLYAVLIQDVGWRDAFVVLGVLYFVILITGVFTFHKNEKVPDYAGGCSDWKCGVVSRRNAPLLLLWIVDRVMTSVVTYGLLMNLTDYARRSGKSLVSSAWMTSLFTLGEASTYLLGAGVMALTRNFFKQRLRFVLLAFTALLCLSLFLMEFAMTTAKVAYGLSFLSGFAIGPSITFLFPAGQEITTLPGHLAYPFTLGSMGLGMMISPALSAVIAQRFAYKWFFATQGGLACLKFIVLAASTVYLECIPAEVPATTDTSVALEEKEEIQESKN